MQRFRMCTLTGVILSLAVCLTTGALAQTPTPPQPTPAPAPQPPKPTPPAPVPGQKPADAKPADAKPTPPVKPGTPKPYKDVITAEAKSDTGLFTVHRVDEKVYFEIPTSAYDRDMLWQTEIAQTGSGSGYGGTHVGEKVIRWTRRNNTVYMRSISYAVRGDGKTAIQKAVDATNVSPIIMTFPVEAEGQNKSAVIDVSRFYTSDAGPVPAGGGADPSRSYLDRIKSFPTNIEARSVVTYNRGGALTTTVHYSLTLLPEKPMEGRYFDSRVGYFTVGFDDYGSNENRVKEREFIARYRLEKKDPTAKISDPVKPIVYYISREVPEKWRPYMKHAVEAWNPCFEQAGFSHAIVAKDAPTEKEDPNWDPEDARYSVIRWAALPIENAMGPHISDPRSGEILSAHIIVWHNILKLTEQWYWAQVACMDKRAATLPLPESVMGELMEVVITHEVGHTLGLRHNHKASASFTAAQLRDPAFTAKYGDEASIMDYGRFNYVAQPGDNARLTPMVGPYDKFAIEWGYKPIAGATTPDAEKSSLDEIAARQATDPMLRFGGEDSNAQVDPTVQTEDLGSDPIEATYYGLKNIDRHASMLMSATAKFGEDYSSLEEMYSALLNQRITELMHVVKIVGGVTQTDFHVGHGGEVFRPVPKERQAKAVKFLVDNAFSTPHSLMSPYILDRIEYGGVANRVLRSQNVILIMLLSESKIQRLMDRQAVAGAQAYTVTDLVTDVQNGIWSELAATSPKIEMCRRSLQRAYLKTLQPRLVGDNASQSEFRPVALGALRNLQQRVAAAIPKTTDQATLLHLRDCKTQIDNILNPKFASAGGGGGMDRFFFPGYNYEASLPEAQKPSYECNLAAQQDWLKTIMEPNKK